MGIVKGKTRAAVTRIQEKWSDAMQCNEQSDNVFVVKCSMKCFRCVCVRITIEYVKRAAAASASACVVLVFHHICYCRASVNASFVRLYNIVCIFICFSFGSLLHMNWFIVPFSVHPFIYLFQSFFIDWKLNELSTIDCYSITNATIARRNTWFGEHQMFWLMHFENRISKWKWRMLNGEHFGPIQRRS